MTTSTTTAGDQRRASRGLTVALALAAAALGVAPLLLLRSPEPVAVPSGVAVFPTSTAVDYVQERVGDDNSTGARSTGARSTEARITNVQVIDFDEDGANDVLACDAARNSVLLYRRDASGQWREEVLATGLKVPAHATVVDLDSDGDRDVVVAVLGDILPCDEIVGRVVLLEREGSQYRQRILLDDVRRVADVQPGDFDGDGDIDLAVAVFGYARGEVLWLENRGEGRFRDHQLLSRPGTIHVPVGDYDADGDLDIATVVSQDEEEVWGLENQGDGSFRPRRLFFLDNFDAGSGGLVACDLDQDGDLDFLLPLGDNLEHGHGWPQPYHGCLWLENRGEWSFHSQRIAELGGTYAAAPGDLDQDGDLDVALVSMSNDWADPTHASVVWLENDGQQHFQTWRVDTSPAELITVATGDLNHDGRLDVVAGGLHLPTSAVPDPRRITAWISKEGAR